MVGCQKNRWWRRKTGRTPHQCRGSQLPLRCHLNGPRVPAADQEADCSSGRSIIGRVSYLWNTRPSTSYGCGSGSDPSLVPPSSDSSLLRMDCKTLQHFLALLSIRCQKPSLPLPPRIYAPFQLFRSCRGSWSALL